MHARLCAEAGAVAVNHGRAGGLARDGAHLELGNVPCLGLRRVTDDAHRRGQLLSQVHVLPHHLLCGSLCAAAPPGGGEVAGAIRHARAARILSVCAPPPRVPWQQPYALTGQVLLGRLLRCELFGTPVRLSGRAVTACVRGRVSGPRCVCA